MDHFIIDMIFPFLRKKCYRDDGVLILVQGHTGSIERRLLSHRYV